MLRATTRFRAIPLATVALVLAYAALTQTTMQPRVVNQQPFQVIGIAASTSNAKEAGPDAIIGKQWHRFMSEDLINKIPNRVDQTIYAVYTDYTSDFNGQYMVILGAKVRPIPNPTIPDGMVIKTVPAGRYAVFTSERGPVVKVVVDTWKQIWAYYQSPQNGQRAYQADFEVYDQRAANPNNAQVDIYVGLK
jgi:predicted transcriptional regulator YdeE